MLHQINFLLSKHFCFSLHFSTLLYTSTVGKKSKKEEWGEEKSNSIFTVKNGGKTKKSFFLLLSVFLLLHIRFNYEVTRFTRLLENRRREERKRNSISFPWSEKKEKDWELLKLFAFERLFSFSFLFIQFLSDADSFSLKHHHHCHRYKVPSRCASTKKEENS